MNLYILKANSAEEMIVGYEHWFLKGKRHRNNYPSSTYSDGYMYWYKKGLCYREEDPRSSSFI